MLIERLTQCRGIPGREGNVRALIKEELEGHVDSFSSDPMGTLYAWKGPGEGPLLMLAAHMDEVGFMITGFEKDGTIRFVPVGGVDLRVVVGKKVLLGEDAISGVIGARPVHMQKPEERNRPFSQKELYIDIGSRSEEESKNNLKIGDAITFATKTEFLGESVIKGKAFDDRAGCACIIEILKEDLPITVCGAFTVQEEVGLRGAGIAAHNVKPDLALVLEGTTASDVPESKEHRYSTSMGQGPALTVMDRAFVANEHLNRHVMELARKASIPFQIRRSNIGGTDSGRIYLSREGIPTIGISLPCRYIHGPASLLNMKDYQGMKDWVQSIIKDIAEGGFPLAITY